MHRQIKGEIKQLGKTQPLRQRIQGRKMLQIGVKTTDRYRDTLGHTGGAGGEQQVRRIVLANINRIQRCIGCLCRQILQAEYSRCLRIGNLRPLGASFITHNYHRCTGQLPHALIARCGKRRIQRHPGESFRSAGEYCGIGRQTASGEHCHRGTHGQRLLPQRDAKLCHHTR